MPFAAAIPLISAGVGALGSIFGGKPKAPVNPNQAQINALETSLNAPGAAPDNSATDSAESFYKTILSGSQANTRALLGPDVNTIMGQYDNAAKAAAQLGPRGGGRDAVLADAPFQAAGAYTKLLGQAKSTAASGLAQIGGQKMQQQTALMGQKEGELNSLIGGGNQAAQLALQSQENQQKQWSGLGTGIGTLLGGVKWGGGSSDSGSTFGDLSVQGE